MPDCLWGVADRLTAMVLVGVDAPKELVGPLGFEVVHRLLVVVALAQTLHPGKRDKAREIEKCPLPDNQMSQQHYRIDSDSYISSRFTSNLYTPS